MFRMSFGKAFRTGLALGAAGLALGTAPASARTAPADWIVNDFETGTLSTPMNGFWYFFTDRNSPTVVDTVMGNSTLTSVDEFGFPFVDSLGQPDPRTFPPGRDSSSTRSLKFGYALGDRPLSCGTSCTYAPYVGFGFGFSTITNTLDFSTSGGIAFWARAEKDSIIMNVSVSAEDTTTGAPDYSQRFVIDTTWKRYTIQLVASEVFKQPNYGPRKPFNATLVKAMNFGVNKQENPTVTQNALFLDDLVVIGWEYVDPSSVRRPVAGRAGTRMDLGRGGRIRYRIPGLQGKGLTVDAAGRIHISID
jgi:hypothetical protein